jgi:hypothetical protein
MWLFARARRGKEKPRIARGPAGSGWRCDQAMMLTRVPCPGGSGAGGGGAVLESSWLLASGALVWTGGAGVGGRNGGGGGVVTLEILIEAILLWI